MWRIVPRVPAEMVLWTATAPFCHLAVLFSKKACFGLSCDSLISKWMFVMVTDADALAHKDKRAKSDIMRS